MEGVKWTIHKGMVGVEGLETLRRLEERKEWTTPMSLSKVVDMSQEYAEELHGCVAFSLHRREGVRFYGLATSFDGIFQEVRDLHVVSLGYM